MKSIKEDTDYDKAIEFISLISPKLFERGTNSDLCLKNSHNIKNIKIVSNVTEQSGTYIINEDDILKKDKSQTEAITPINESNILGSVF